MSKTNDIFYVKDLLSCVEIDYGNSFYRCKRIKDYITYTSIFVECFEGNLKKKKFISKFKWLLYSVYFLSNLTSTFELYLIQKDGNNIGCFCLDYFENSSCLYDFCLVEEYRGKGLGSYYLDGILKKLYEEGIADLFLQVDEDNTVALSLYMKKGFYLSVEE